MKLLKMDTDNKKVEVEILKEELEGVLSTREGAALVEFEIAGSEDWAKDGPPQIGMRVARLIQSNTRPVAELTIRVGKPWMVKQVITLQDVMFPEGFVSVKDSPEA